MNNVKILNIPFFLILMLFTSPYFGVGLINFTILGISIFFIINIKIYEFDLVDKILLSLGIYFILSSIFHPSYFLNSVIFFKFIVLFLGVKTLFNFLSKINFEKINLICLSIIIFLVFDLFYQKIFGEDIFGFQTLNGERLTGPYKNKMIPGGILLYISSYFIFYNYLKFISSSKVYLRLVSFFIILVFTLAILITGERMNYLSLLLLLIFSVILFKNKTHFLFTIIVIFISFSVIINDQYLSTRYKAFIFTLKPTLTEKSFNQDEIIKFKEDIKNNKIEGKSKDDINFFDTTWGSHYLTAFELIKKEPLFGNGIKSFRFLCGKQKIETVTKDKRCSTHPHNIHLEIISETGVVGYLIFILFISILLFNSYKILKNNKLYSNQYLYLIFLTSVLIFIITIFPFKSTGRFFSSFYGFLFWLNLSVLNASIYSIRKKYLNK